MNLIRRTAALAVMQAVDFIAGIFDRGIDGAIASLTKAEAALAKQVERIEARVNRELDTQLLSYDREAAARKREVAIREASRSRAATLAEQRTRAHRIAGRIAKLLD